MTINKQKLISFNIFFILFLILNFSFIFFTYYKSNSMAIGTFFVMVFFLIYSLINRDIWNYKFINNKMPIYIIMVFLFIFFHGLLIYYFSNYFIFKRFFLSFLFLILMIYSSLIGVIILSVFKNFLNKAIYYNYLLLYFILIFSSLGLGPLRDIYPKPLFFFSEPSHFSLVFLPLFFYINLMSNIKTRIIYLSTVFLLCLLIENLTLMVGILFISIFLLRIFLLLPLLIIFVILLGLLNYEYFLSRIIIDNLNTSTLAFLSGWERAYLSLIETNGIGLGFQQFGYSENSGYYFELLLLNGLENLNLYDGSMVASKIIAEFGVFGIFLLIIYIYFFLKISSSLLIENISIKYDNLNIFFRCIFILFFVDIFIRGVGYFSTPTFLFFMAIIYIFKFKKYDY